jgi:hypothetical protein
VKRSKVSARCTDSVRIESLIAHLFRSQGEFFPYILTTPPDTKYSKDWNGDPQRIKSVIIVKAMSIQNIIRVLMYPVTENLRKRNSPPNITATNNPSMRVSCANCVTSAIRLYIPTGTNKPITPPTCMRNMESEVRENHETRVYTRVNVTNQKGRVLTDEG